MQNVCVPFAKATMTPFSAIRTGLPYRKRNVAFPPAAAFTSWTRSQRSGCVDREYPSTTQIDFDSRKDGSCST